MGSPTFADKIFEVFKANPNVEVTVNQIRREAGTRQSDGEQYTEQQVQTAISNLRNRGRIPIDVVVAGKVYRYEPGKVLPQVSEKGAKLFEQVATLKNGALLLQDESGRVYRATELE